MARRQQYIFAEDQNRGHGGRIAVLIVLALVITALFIWNFALNNTVVYTTEYVTISSLPAALENWTILHLSDLNGSDVGDHQSAVRKAVGSKNFSCVVLSGNMVGETGDVTALTDLLNVLPKNTPVLLLPGDGDPPLYDTTPHSTVSAYADWAVALQNAGVTILDEPIAFKREKATIWFVPEDLYSLNIPGTRKAYQNQLDTLTAQAEPLTPEQTAIRRNAEFQIARLDRIQASVETMKATDIQVAVSHLPLTREYVINARANTDSKDMLTMHHVSLVLAGGYCAGQWRLPGGGAIHVPEMGFFPEDEGITGMSYLGGIWQHISPGLGASNDYPFRPFRLFNSPGATRLVLTTDVR